MKISEFLSENFQFLNKRVFIMRKTGTLSGQATLSKCLVYFTKSDLLQKGKNLLVWTPIKNGPHVQNS